MNAFWSIKQPKLPHAHIHTHTHTHNRLPEMKENESMNDDLGEGGEEGLETRGYCTGEEILHRRRG